MITRKLVKKKENRLTHRQEKDSPPILSTYLYNRNDMCLKPLYLFHANERHKKVVNHNFRALP